jgi:hypothetical protein
MSGSPDFEACIQKWSLPFDSQHQFGALFQTLDDQKTEMRVLHWTLSMTKLEDVFMSFAHESHQESPNSSFNGDGIANCQGSSSNHNDEGDRLPLTSSASQPNFTSHAINCRHRNLSTLSQYDVRWMENFELKCLSHSTSEELMSPSACEANLCGSPLAMPPSPLRCLPHSRGTKPRINAHSHHFQDLGGHEATDSSIADMSGFMDESYIDTGYIERPASVLQSPQTAFGKLHTFI